MKGTEALFLFVLLVSSFTGTLAVAQISGDNRATYLPENSQEGTPVVQLDAVNPDGDTLNFEIENLNPFPGAQYYFRIFTSGNTGRVVVNGTGDHAPDRETTPIITFDVVLKNVTPAEIDRVSVTVILQDVNDNDPVWANEPTESPAVTISEFAAIGTVVYAFLVTDVDVPQNQVNYYLESPIDGTFSVGQLSGLLILDSTPTPGNISVSVRVQDEGIPSRSIILGPITILVLDVPDPAPVFTQSLYSVTLMERNYTSISSQRVLVTVLARVFTESTATIRYTQVMTGGPTDYLFSNSPNTSTGTAGSVVSAVGDIDYEVYTRLSFNIEAVKVNPLITSEVLSYPAIATVAVTLLDINDNAPTFITNHYIGDVSELADSGTVVITTVDAFDLDEGINNVFQYSLASGQDCETFAIDPITARITLCDATALDYETRITYEFEIQAVETLTPMGERLTGTATVIISVENENDNLPVFDRETYTFEVKEGQDAGPLTASNPSGLMTIQAEDADLGTFGVLTYNLSGSGSGTRIDVDSTNGTIRTVVKLDREDREQYHLTLIAQDGGSNPHRAFTDVIINVLDINDESPTFNPNMYTVTLREDMSYSNFLTVIATDDDEPGSINTMIDYSLERVDQTANLTGIFSINSNGHLSAFNLNHEVDPFYRLKIIATDRGTDPGPLVGNAFVNITVLDANEHIPVFTPTSYTANITEDVAVGGTITTVTAADLDNHDITYSIATTGDGSFFSVDARSGVVTLAHEVDHEDSAQQILSFTVLATDNGSPMLTSSATVTVTVNDVNDNTPVITNPPDHDGFQHTILEEAASIPAILLTVEADDADGDSDGELVYTLMDATGATAFTIGNITGEVRQVEQLDRETNATHLLTIEVCDQGATPKCSSVVLTIIVRDYNDNPPVFSTLNSTVTISECSPGGSSVTMVTAEDTLDEPGINTAVQYSFISGDTAKFVLESSGTIYLNEDGVDYEDPADRSLTVTILATDMGTPTQSATVTLTVEVTDCNDNPPVFNMSSYEVIINEIQAATTTQVTIFNSTDTTDEDGTAADRVVTYMIVTGAGIPDWFGVDSTSGDLYIKTGEKVDRESNMITRDSNGRGIVSFGIQAINNKAAADPGEDFTTTVPVTVKITDINDNKPVFGQSGMVSVMVAEHSPVNTLLTVLSATDADFDQLNEEIFFSITAGNNDGKFDLKTDGDLASVILVGDVDRENTSSYTITVTAENNVTLSDGTASTSTIPVQITVTSTNDHTPMFARTQYTATINEYNNLTMMGVTQNTSVHFPNPPVATDGDGDSLEYFITGGNDDLGIFGIPDKTQAIVRVIKPDLIDHETTSEYDIIVTVRDTVAPVRQNTTHIVITVVDLNDNYPYFLDAEYTGTIVEEEPGNTQVLVTPTIRVADPDDLDGVNELELTLIDSNPQPQNFKISQDGSIVNATTSLDREDEDSFIITVQVQDSATNRATTTVRITVLDVNDNAPIIQETEMELAVKLPEDFPIGDPVQTVTARDADIGGNADFQWHLTGGNGQFDIDRITGVISLNQLLDIEDITEYELNVTASDIVHQTHIIVMVTVVNDTNDNDPRFVQSVYEGEIEENTGNLTKVRIKGTLASAGMFLIVNATDRDVTSDVEYELEAGTTAPFDVDRNSGEIYVAGALDREMPNGFFYSFTIVGVDTVMGSTPDTTIIEITIVDVNDESPMFSTSEYMVSVQEGTPAYLAVLEVSAVDADIGNNSLIEYSIRNVTPSAETGYFGIDPVTGDVFPTREVAFDSATDPTEITLEIVARDMGPFPKEDTANVVLHLIDVNDEAPEFNETNYEFQIRENVDGRVGTIYAVDRDISSANTNITYSIRSGEGSSRFSINELTGEISTVGTLDREDRALYTLTVAAQDNPTTGMPRSAFATVNVDILDENDNDPDFDPDSYLIRISEGSIINSTVVQLLAFDMDKADTPNSQLTFTLAGDTFAFKVDATDGTIRTTQTFDYENRKEYYLVATVRDNGTPQRDDMANITVRMVDENDNSPMFVHSSAEEVDVIEELPIDNLIFTVNATDIDDGLNKELAYSFGGTSQTKGPFKIDRINGEVRTTMVLDRETEDKYELTVFVSDQNGVGGAVRHTAGTLTVNLLDINDELPYFTEDPKTIEIPEDQAFSSAGVVVDDAPEASDNDIGVNAVIYYHFLTGTGGTDCIHEFCINPSNGEIRVVAEVDRETQAEYSIQVVVSNFPVWNESARLEGLTTVTITVEDINDSPPVFINETLLAAVAEEADFATTVTTLRTSDGDLGNGSVSHFEILTAGAPFVVDEDTGVVTTAGVFNGQSGTKYEIRVRAFDNFGNPPSLSTSNVMTVFVFKTTEQIIATFGRPKEQIDAKADRIEQVIAEVTGARIIINEIQVHETSNGGFDTTKTDVIFFALDPNTGNVLEPTAVIEVIDDEYEPGTELYDLFEECDLESIITHPEASRGSDDVPDYVWIIVALLLLFLLIVCCCLLCVFIGERRRNRKLRKRREMSSYQSELDQFRSQMEYAQVSNPLWVSPYDNWEETTTASGTQLEADNPLYESQELTIEMFQDDDDEDVLVSRENLVKPPPLSHSTPSGQQRESNYSGANDDELLAEAIGERKYYDFDSETSLI